MIYLHSSWWFMNMLVPASPIVKMGAFVMGMFTGLNIHITKSEEDILRVFTPPPMPFVNDECRNTGGHSASDVYIHRE